MGVNKVILVGHVGKDPIITYPTNDKPVSNFTLATSEIYKDKNGEKKTHTEWHKLVAWGKLAEIIEKYVKKGSHLYIEGKLTTRSYEKDGKTNYITEVNVSTIEMLGSKEKSNQVVDPVKEENINEEAGNFEETEELPF